MANIIRLGKTDLNGILIVEKDSFIPPLQAKGEKILKRLETNHTYLGTFIHDKLIGTLAFRYDHFPKDFSQIPTTFEDFSNRPNVINADSMFIYSFGILPSHRSLKNALDLIRAGFEIGRREGARYVIGDGRCPSYNGSLQFEQEKIIQNSRFKESLDKHIQKETIPSEKELSLDPVLAFYLKFIKLRPLLISPNFIPEDLPAGGKRVILYKQI